MNTIPVSIPPRSVARNILLSLIGYATPFLVGVFTLPKIVHGLGAERFGLLTLVWTFLGYFSLFDLGLGRAITKSVAEAVARRNEEEISGLVWAAAILQAIIGLAIFLLLIPFVQIIVSGVFRISPNLYEEGKLIFLWIGLSIPILTTSNLFAGVLEGKQRFDLVMAVRAPSLALVFVLPLLGIIINLNLPSIVGLIVIGRLASLVGFYLLSVRLIPGLARLKPKFNLLPSLLTFGGWTTLSNIVLPVFAYVDRFLVGSILGVTALAFYVVPYELTARLLVIPASVSSVLFPALSGLSTLGNRGLIDRTVMRSVKYSVLAMAPIVFLIIILAPVILRVWLDEHFATSSTSILRILAVAALLTSVGYIPFTLLQAHGRPDVISKYHLVELPLYVAVSFLSISRFGGIGAALALCARMIWTIPVFFVLSLRIVGVRMGALSENGTTRSFATAALLILIALLLVAGNVSIIGGARFWAPALLLYALTVWSFVLDSLDKSLAARLFGLSPSSSRSGGGY